MKEMDMIIGIIIYQINYERKYVKYYHILLIIKNISFQYLIHLKYCFYIQIFGFDFIIDDNEDVILLEINNGPCLEGECCTEVLLLYQICEKVVEDTLSIVLDPLIDNNITSNIYFSCNNKFNSIILKIFLDKGNGYILIYKDHPSTAKNPIRWSDSFIEYTKNTLKQINDELSENEDNK